MEPEESLNNNWIFNLVAGILAFVVLSDILGTKGYPLFLASIIALLSIWVTTHLTSRIADYMDNRQRRN